MVLCCAAAYQVQGRTAALHLVRIDRRGHCCGRAATTLLIRPGERTEIVLGSQHRHLKCAVMLVCILDSLIDCIKREGMSGERIKPQQTRSQQSSHRAGGRRWIYILAADHQVIAHDITIWYSDVSVDPAHQDRGPARAEGQ